MRQRSRQFFEDVMTDHMLRYRYKHGCSTDLVHKLSGWEQQEPIIRQICDIFFEMEGVLFIFCSCYYGWVAFG